MHIRTHGQVAHLQGDLTHAGVTHNILKILAEYLQQIATAGMKSIHIDCSKVHSADTQGLQLLYVWMQCARFREMEPKLINIPDCLKRTLQIMGLGQCFTEDPILVG